MQPWSGAPWQPRAWQRDALPVIEEALAGGRRAVVSAVMGSGKSVLLTEVAARARARGQRVLITTPTQKLVRQLAATGRSRFTDMGPLAHGVVGAYFAHAHEGHADIVVACNASVPRLVAEGHRFGLWIADEVHKTESTEFHVAAEALEGIPALGFTATPYRSNESESLRLWDEVVYRYTPADALRDGVIVPWRIVPWDGDGSDDLDDVCLEMIAAHAEGPGIVNAKSIEDAEAFAAELSSRGVACEAIHSRLADGQREDLLDRLEAGELGCLAHVNLLAEGVDLPWLRWLCLRRPVGARVRFQQEIGRALRAAPGKSHAVFLDPHDLFGTFGMSYREALGWPEEGDAEGEGQDGPSPLTRDGQLALSLGGPALAVATDPVSAYCRRLLLVMQAIGAAGEGKIQSSSWRRMASTAKQQGALRRMAGLAGRLPEAHVEVIRDLIGRRAADLTRGAASDLLDLLMSLRTEPWPEGAEADVLGADILSGYRSVWASDPSYYVSTVLTRHVAALVVVWGGRVRLERARPRRSDDTGLTVALKGFDAARAIAARDGNPGAPVASHDGFALSRWPREGGRIVDEAKNPAASYVWPLAKRAERRLTA